MLSLDYISPINKVCGTQDLSVLSSSSEKAKNFPEHFLLLHLDKSYYS